MASPQTNEAEIASGATVSEVTFSDLSPGMIRLKHVDMA
jgi:hypothetical protein